MKNRGLNKEERNKLADQETQLVSIKTSQTDENKINLEKIREIRLALRRRYSNRNNFSKIFKEWDKSNKGVIGVIDAHKMINNLGIPINFNEARAFIASINKENKENLDIESFMHMVFTEDQSRNNDNLVGNFPFKPSK